MPRIFSFAFCSYVWVDPFGIAFLSRVGLFWGGGWPKNFSISERDLLSFAVPSNSHASVMDFVIYTSLLPKRGDAAFVHYFHDPVHDTEVCKMARGSPFKCIVKAVTFKPEGIIYTVAHVTDDCVHEAYICDFVSMGCGCYARMRRVARADAAAHDAWQLALQRAEAQFQAAQEQVP